MGMLKMEILCRKDRDIINPQKYLIVCPQCSSILVFTYLDESIRAEVDCITKYINCQCCNAQLATRTTKMNRLRNKAKLVNGVKAITEKKYQKLKHKYDTKTYLGELL